MIEIKNCFYLPFFCSGATEVSGPYPFHPASGGRGDVRQYSYTPDGNYLVFRSAHASADTFDLYIYGANLKMRGWFGEKLAVLLKF